MPHVGTGTIYISLSEGVIEEICHHSSVISCFVDFNYDVDNVQESYRKVQYPVMLRLEKNLEDQP